MVTPAQPLQYRSVRKFISHSKRAARIAVRYGWLPGARYTNLRDARSFDRLGFLDICWSYNSRRHLAAARATRPLCTVAQDVVRRRDLEGHRGHTFIFLVPGSSSTGCSDTFHSEGFQAAKFCGRCPGLGGKQQPRDPRCRYGTTVTHRAPKSAVSRHHAAMNAGPYSAATVIDGPFSRCWSGRRSGSGGPLRHTS